MTCYCHECNTRAETCKFHFPTKMTLVHTRALLSTKKISPPPPHDINTFLLRGGVWVMLIRTTISMAVPHLEGSRGSAHPHPKIKGSPTLENNFPWLCRLQFGLKMRRRPRTVGPLLYIRFCTFLNAQTQ